MSDNQTALDNLQRTMYNIKQCTQCIDDIRLFLAKNDELPAAQRLHYQNLLEQHEDELRGLKRIFNAQLSLVEPYFIKN